MKLSHILAGLIAGTLTLASDAAGATATGLDVGDRFPELVLPSLADGEPTSIASFRGRKLVLHVWASW